MTADSIVWVPGWGMNAYAWGHVPREGPDLPATFVSFRGARTPADLVELTAEALRPGRLAAGWSIGATLVIRAIVERRIPVAGVALFGATARFVHDDPGLGWSSRVLERMRKRLREAPDAVLTQFARSLFAPGEQGQAEPFMRAVYGDRPPLAACDWDETSLAAGLRLLAEVDVTDDLARLGVPVLWVHGEADPICPVGAWRHMRERLSDAPDQRFAELPAAGHACCWTRSGEIGKSLKEFVAWLP